MINYLFVKHISISKQNPVEDGEVLIDVDAISADLADQHVDEFADVSIKNNHLIFNKSQITNKNVIYILENCVFDFRNSRSK